MLLLELPNGEVSHGIKEAIDPKGKAKLIQFRLQAANIVAAHLGFKITSFEIDGGDSLPRLSLGFWIPS